LDISAAAGKNKRVAAAKSPDAQKSEDAKNKREDVAILPFSPAGFPRPAPPMHFRIIGAGSHPSPLPYSMKRA
jgi:hypothetical protein